MGYNLSNPLSTKNTEKVIILPGLKARGRNIELNSTDTGSVLAKKVKFVGTDFNAYRVSLVKQIVFSSWMFQ